MNDVDAHELVTATARSARVAQRGLAGVPRAVKDAALEAMARSLTEHGEAILAANFLYYVYHSFSILEIHLMHK